MHIPERMCIACRHMKPKSELIKIVKNGEVAEIDIKNKKFGRGAYLCKNQECIENAKKRQSLSKHFKMKVDAEIYDEIRKVSEDE